MRVPADRPVFGLPLNDVRKKLRRSAVGALRATSDRFIVEAIEASYSAVSSEDPDATAFVTFTIRVPVR